MNKKSEKKDLPIGKMIIGLTLLIFSPIILNLITIILWTIFAMLGTKW